MKKWKKKEKSTISSIFIIILTVSEASSKAEVETSKGWTTFSSKIFVIHPLRTLIPAFISPFAWRLRNSVTIEIGLSPAFSASVNGIIYDVFKKKNKKKKKKKKKFFEFEKKKSKKIVRTFFHEKEQGVKVCEKVRKKQKRMIHAFFPSRKFLFFGFKETWIFKPNQIQKSYQKINELLILQT